MMKKIMMLCVCLTLVFAAVAKQPIRTLIVTGQNNHNWPVSHVALKQLLENTELFTVDVAVTPAKGGDMSKFLPQFSDYELVVLDYNGDRWSEQTDQAFVEYVKKGGGVVVYHAADNAFADWPEYNQVIALGGWENRSEKSGPYVYWKDGEVVKDNSPGRGGAHGRQHEFVMLDRSSAKHPVMKGLPAEWKHAIDELYGEMRGPGNVKDLLYTAYADKSTGGSGREEPLVFTVDYGKARIFHIMIGHAGETLEKNPAMQCVGFQTLFLRGSEWAATGKVTQDVPSDFPTADQVKLRMDYK